jgi:DNA-binding transcriptional regulator YdaS (Cro superfamily)
MPKITHSARALDRAIKLAGSVNKLAKAVGYTQNAVWKAKDCGRITAELAIRIEAATGGKVTREQLAPQVFKLPRRIPVMDGMVDDDEAVA